MTAEEEIAQDDLTQSDPHTPGTVGVLVMAYGTPASTDDVEAYYTHIRRGRPPEPAQLEELIARYDAIGGISPMAARTAAQIDALRGAANAVAPSRYIFELGQKHASPFIEDGVAALAGHGVERIVGVVLAPHYSSASVGEYLRRAEASANDHGLPFVGLESWAMLDAFCEHQAASLRECLADMPDATKVLFTAHSLPERVLVDDPYADELRESAEEIANLAGLGQWASWSLGWQSAGRTPEPWRGPDVLEVIRDLAETGRAEGIIVVPQGFTSDHLEVLYDLDIEAAGVAEGVGLAFARTQVVNDDAEVMAALAATIDAVVAETEQPEQ